MWFVKSLLVVTFVIIFIQDYKSRLVYWFLYPLIGVFSFLIQISYNTIYSSLINSLMNLAFVGFILITCYSYSKLKLKQSFLKEVFGLGDVLFLLAICFSFSTVSFLILFVFGLFFSLVLHLILKKSSKDESVPLAGYLSLFFGVIYIISFLCECSFLYAY